MEMREDVVRRSELISLRLSAGSEEDAEMRYFLDGAETARSYEPLQRPWDLVHSRAMRFQAASRAFLRAAPRTR